MTCHPGALLSITFELGAGMEAGSGRMTLCGTGAVSPADAGSAPAQRSLTANRERLRKRGQGLRCGQEGEGPQTAYCGGYPGAFAGSAVHPANIQDRDGAKLVLEGMVGQYPRLRVIWADGAYGGKLVQWAKETGGWSLELVRRPSGQRTFQVLPGAG